MQSRMFLLQEYESKESKVTLLENEKCEIEKQKALVVDECSSLKAECKSLQEQVSLFLIFPSFSVNCFDYVSFHITLTKLFVSALVYH